MGCEWVEKVGSDAGNRGMELRLEPSHGRGELAVQCGPGRQVNGTQASLHRACVLNSKLYLAHLGEKAQEWPARSGDLGSRVSTATNR